MSMPNGQVAMASFPDLSYSLVNSLALPFNRLQLLTDNHQNTGTYTLPSLQKYSSSWCMRNIQGPFRKKMCKQSKNKDLLQN